MSTSRLYKYLELYIKLLPIPVIYSTIVGTDIGIEQYRYNTNIKNTDINRIDIYSDLIGYTSIGVITGITYPISFPLFGCYVLYKNKK